MFLVAALPAFVLYLATLCPHLYWFDSAEFVNDAYLLDIPHPPGYPLYNLLAAAFLKLPVLSIPARVNLLSSVASTLAVGMFALLLEQAGAGAALAVTGAWVLAVSPQFWELSIVAEVYGLEVLFLALALYLLARRERRERAGCSPPPLGPVAFMCGLMLFHRPTALFFLVPWAILYRERISRSEAPWLACIGLLGALPYLHTAAVFFLRAGPPGGPWSINYFDFPRTPEIFVRICTGTLYARNLQWLAPGELAHEVTAFVALARAQIGAVLLALGALGMIRAWTRPDRLCRAIAAVVVGNLAFFLFYNALEKDTMYVPSFVGLLALALGIVGELATTRARRGMLAVALAAFAAWQLATNCPEIDKHDYREVQRCVESTTRLLPPGAVLYLTDDLIIHPFLYARIVDHRRPDVTLVEVDNFTPEVVAGLSAHLAARREVFSPLFLPEAGFDALARRFRLLPRGFLYQILAGPVPALPPQTSPTGRFGPVEVRGVTVRGSTRPGAGRPGSDRGRDDRTRDNRARDNRARDDRPGAVQPGPGPGPVELVPRCGQLQVALTVRLPGPVPTPTPTPTPVPVPMPRPGPASAPGAAPDPVVLFRWTRPGGGPDAALCWAYRLGYQGRPVAGGVLTEEYLLKIPRKVAPASGAGPGELSLAIWPSLARALESGQLREVSTASLEEQAFFKGREGGFVRCMEAGYPAYSRFLTVTPAGRAALEAGPALSLATLEVAPEP